MPVGGRQIALIGDAELDEGACWEAIADPMVSQLGEVMWVVDLNRQSLDRVVPDIAAGRLQAMFEAAGWHAVMVKYGARLARRAGAARAHRPDAQRGVPAAAARATRPSCASGLEVATDDLDDAALLADVPRPRRPRPRRAARRLPPGRRGPRPAERRLRLHDQGLVAADRGPPGQPLRAAHATQQYAELAAQLGADPDDPWARVPGRRPRRRELCARRRRARLARERAGAAAVDAAGGPGRRSAASTRGTASTQQAFGRFFADLAREAPEVAERVVTVSPDVGTSTNLGGWINKAGIWSVGERIDWFADDTDTLVRWRESDHGRHIELGIAEVNLVGLLGELGATWSRDGQPLLPVGTIYDPFVARALEPWSFGIYAGGQSILVGTPSGVTLGPEGGAHQSVITPSIGIEQPGCVAYEPAFGQDLEWCLLHALSRLGRPGGDVGVLPPLDAADRPGAAHRARARRRSPAATGSAPQRPPAGRRSP